MKGFCLSTLTKQPSVLLGLAEQYLCNLLPASLMKPVQGLFE